MMKFRRRLRNFEHAAQCAAPLYTPTWWATRDRLIALYGNSSIEFGDALGEQAAFGFEFGGLEGGAVGGKGFFMAAEGLQ